MTIINYFEQENDFQQLLKAELLKSDWRAAHYLYDLLNDGRLEEKCGQTALLMLTEGDTLAAFCTLAEKDEIDAPEMSPWIGFVYTYPQFRGRRFSQQLIDYACNLARNNGSEQVYISSEEVGLYEKYGFEFIGMMETIWGEETQVFSRSLF